MFFFVLVEYAKNLQKHGLLLVYPISENQFIKIHYYG